MTMGNPEHQVLQAIITALQALAPRPTNPTTFAIMPGQQKFNEIIDYVTKGGKALYEEVGSALKSPFDLEAFI